MKFTSLIGAVAAGLMLNGCAAVNTYDYAPPQPNQAMDFTRDVHTDYDAAWGALIDYVSSTFFTISNFEKQSGLLTLSFGETNIPDYVDCGMWNGNVPYAARDLGFRLSGRMNLRVKPLGNGLTNIKVSTRYLLRDNSGNVYEFRESEPASINVNNAAPGTPPVRTCQSTQLAEKTIIRGIEAIATR